MGTMQSFWLVTMLIVLSCGEQFPKEELERMIKAVKEKKQKDDDMHEYTRIEEYKNGRLWACYLLAECKLLEAKVLTQLRCSPTLVASSSSIDVSAKKSPTKFITISWRGVMTR